MISSLLILLGLVFPLSTYILSRSREHVGWQIKKGFVCKSCKIDLLPSELVELKEQSCESCKRDVILNSVLNKKSFKINLKSERVTHISIALNIISLILNITMLCLVPKYIVISNPYLIGNSLILISNLLLFCNFYQNSRKKKNKVKVKLYS